MIEKRTFKLFEVPTQSDQRLLLRGDLFSRLATRLLSFAPSSQALAPAELLGSSSAFFVLEMSFALLLKCAEFEFLSLYPSLGVCHLLLANGERRASFVVALARELFASKVQHCIEQVVRVFASQARGFELIDRQHILERPRDVEPTQHTVIPLVWTQES